MRSRSKTPTGWRRSSTGSGRSTAPTRWSPSTRGPTQPSRFPSPPASGARRALRWMRGKEEANMATETIQAADHELLVGGERVETGEGSGGHSPYDGTGGGRGAGGE